MTNTKWLSALLAGTALTVASTAAMADTSLLTMTRNAAGEGVTFKIAPSADMPAAATEITVAGEVRALLTSANDGAVLAANALDGTTAVADAGRVNDLGTRARIFVRGKTETAVGLVGANVRIQSNSVADSIVNDYTGYWEFSPGMKLTAGRTDSISSIVYGADWGSTGAVWNGAGAGLTNQGTEQVNVSFATGPVTFAVGIEDNSSAAQFVTDGAGTTASQSIKSSNPAFVGTMNFSSGDFGAQIAGKTQSFKNGGTANTDGDSGYMIGGGIGYNAGAFGIQLGAATGRGLAADYTTVGGNMISRAKKLSGTTFAAPLDLTDDKFNAMSVLGSFAITETTSIEAWYGAATISDFGSTLGNHATPGTLDAKISGYGAGVFWNPVSQLRLGIGGDKTSYNDAAGLPDSTQIGVGAWFKF